MAALSLHADRIFPGDLHEVEEHVGWLLIFSQCFLQKNCLFPYDGLLMRLDEIPMCRSSPRGCFSAHFRRVSLAEKE